MQIENLVFEDHDSRHFENSPDLDCVISAWEEDGVTIYGCAINPDIDPTCELGALRWCAERVTRIEDRGFEEAMRMDGWQHLSNGRWQLWGRAHDLPMLD